MNRKKHRLLPAIAPMLLALSFLTSGCVEPLDPSLRGSTDPNAVSLPIRLYIPNAMPATKAGAGDVSGVSPESQVYRVQVWMFDHQAATETAGDGEKAVAYAEADLSTSNTQNMGPYDQSGYYATWESAKIFRLPLMIPGYVLERSADKMKFDFYVLANAASVGSTAGRESTRGDLKALTFGYTSTTVDPFGPYGPKTGTTPTNALGTSGLGLPISGFFNKSKNASAQSPSVGSDDGVDLSFLRDKNKPGTNPPRPYTNDEINAMSPVVQLERAVSKIRFVFAAPSGMTGMSVTGIEVNGGLIPKQTYLFPREESTTKFELPTNAADATYDAKTISVRVPATIPATIVDPKYLMSTSEKDFTIGTTTYNPSAMTGTDGAQQYSDFLTAAVGAGYATETYVYLRESDKPITGTITYSLDGGTTTQAATFDMTAIEGYTPANTNFHRNHSWIVYAYFQGGGLHIKPVVVADWVYDYNSQTQTALQYYEYLQKGSARVAFSDDSRSLFGYGYTTSTGNDWRRYHPTAKTEWYFRRQSWNSAGHEFDPSQPAGVSCYDWDDWVNSQMIVAPGKNAANVPMYANRIELRTNGFNYSYTSGGNEVTVPIPLTLKVDNPQKFDIVLYHSGSNSYEVFTDGKATFTSAVDKTTTTYFYIVPKDSASEGDHTAAYLLTDPDVSTDETLKNSGLPQEKLPFNTSVFPGSEDNTEIFFYCVALSTFQGFYTPANDPNPLPQNVKVYGSNVITDLP